MNPLLYRNNPYGDDKVIDACSIFGMMDTSGRRFSGDDIITAIANMHDRGNGLGGGFAVYGLYPDYADAYALHVMCDTRQAKEQVGAFVARHFRVRCDAELPTRPRASVVNSPLVHCYFVDVPDGLGDSTGADDYTLARVMDINTGIAEAFVFSSGKNMGVFKGVGYPEDIAEYFCLRDYHGYLWTAHGRFPTNTRGWWGGAHPFSILDWTVVHNGELSSYGINRRHLEQYGYVCTMHTDTEVVAYAVDLLMRRHGLPVELAAKVLAAPLWSRIDRYAPEEKQLCTLLRQAYGSLLLNGPFSVVIAHQGEMIGLTDRIRLRPLTVGVRDDVLYLSSEESAIRLVSPELDDCWSPVGGEPVVGRLGVPSFRQQRGETVLENSVKAGV
ncbi:MAG: class II glutamine amidotransferase [Chloroflexota bacterium]